MRPLCQRKLKNNNNRWEDVSLPLINEYKMNDLYMG